MRYAFSTLNERQRRLFAASEALKLGHGGIVHVCPRFMSGVRTRFASGLTFDAGNGGPRAGFEC